MSAQIEARNLRLVASTTLNGAGDGGQVQKLGDYMFIGHMGHSGVGTSIVDVRDPEAPEVVAQIRRPPGVHSHKVQVADDLLLVNHETYRAGTGAPHDGSPEPERVGLVVYDISRPAEPREIGFLETGGIGRPSGLVQWWPLRICVRAAAGVPRTYANRGRSVRSHIPGGSRTMVGARHLGGGR